ncbi:MAG TPA: lysine/arginine/ornithine ABC transporter substrate-binding protein [Bauldia sp.]|nr:lysine/arginine/ornithine ABC transporter substrate-binding protein [Bauldia sp.]
MRFASSVLVAGAALLAATGFASAKDWSTIRIGSDATYPPFESQDSSGNIVGFDIDIMNAICADIKAKCTYVNQDFDGIIPALLANKFDVIDSSISITPEREKTIDFTNKYYNTPAAIAAAKDSDIKGVTKDDLAGKTIGVQSSTTHATYAEKTFTDSTIKEYPNLDDAKLDLANGRLDAINDDVVVLSEWVDSSDGSCCTIVGTIKPVPEIHGIGAGFGVRKEDTDLKELLNKGIADIRANGTYKQIQDKYFKFDVYGD